MIQGIKQKAAIGLLVALTCASCGRQASTPNGKEHLGSFTLQLSPAQGGAEFVPLGATSRIAARMNLNDSLYLGPPTYSAKYVGMENCGIDWNPTTKMLSVNGRLINNSHLLPISDPHYNKTFLTPIELRYTAMDVSYPGLVVAVNTNLAGAGCGHPGLTLSNDDQWSLDGSGNLTVNTADGFFDCLYPNQPYGDVSASANTPGWDVSGSLSALGNRLAPGQVSSCFTFAQFTLDREQDFGMAFDILGVTEASPATAIPTVNAVTSPTRLTSQTLSGTCSAGGTVYVEGGVGEASGACSAGTYAIAVNLRSDATNDLHVYQVVGGNRSGSSPQQIVQDSLAPAASGSAPANLEQNVSNVTNLVVNFSEPMLRSSFVNRTTVFLDRVAGGSCTAAVQNVTVRATGDMRQVIFDPTATLTSACNYRLRVYGSPQANAVKDLAGNPLNSTYDITFRTATTTADSTAPLILSVFPSDNASDLGLRPQFRVSFSEPMNPTRFSNTSCSSTGYLAAIDLVNMSNTSGSGRVASTVTWNGDASEVTLVPNTDLTPNTQYGFAVGSCNQDLRANAVPRAGRLTHASFTGNYQYAYWHIFRTAASGDTTAPRLAAVLPPSNAQGVAATLLPRFLFSEPLLPSTVNGDNLYLTLAGDTLQVPLVLNLEPAGQVVSFRPNAALAQDSDYALSASGAISDFAGNPLPWPQTSLFHTSATADTAAPTVLRVTPVNGASGVSPYAEMTVWFSEPLDPLTVNDSSVIFDSGGAALIVSLHLTRDDQRLQIIPGTYPLTNGTTYNLRLNPATATSKIKDRAGNELAAQVISFTASSDTIRPTVTAVWPANGATDVPRNSLYVAFFSEPLNPAFVRSQDPSGLETTNQMSLSAPGPTVQWAIPFLASDRSSAVINHRDLFAASTTYTVLWKSGGLRDRSGRTLAANYSTTFTTGTGTDATAPTIAGSNPADGAIHVPLAAPLLVSFSEAIDPRTLTADTVFLHDSKGKGVPFEMNLASNLSTLTIIPVVPLSSNEDYTLWITTALRDAGGGNRLASTFHACFSTDATPCP